MKSLLNQIIPRYLSTLQIGIATIVRTHAGAADDHTWAWGGAGPPRPGI